jgi:molybdopterin-guanine dinucleotide biosynthesis protein A
MGRDKALLPYDGSTLLEHALATLRAVCDTVAIAGNRPDLAEYAPVVDDVYTGCGPLAGMHAALAQTESEWNIFLGVDMPGVKPEDLRRLIAAAEGANDPAVGQKVHPVLRAKVVAVLAESEGRLQPLCGLYRGSLADAFARALGAGERAVIPAVEAICGPNGMVRVAFDAAVLANLNTPEDVATHGAGSTSIR